MILTLYLSLLGISLFIIGLGVVLKENYFSFVGLFFLFLLGNSLLFSGVDYETGLTSSQNYNYVNGTLITTDSTHSTIYTTLKDNLTKWFGFLIAITSGAGMGAILTMANKDFKDKYDYGRTFGE